MELLKVIDEKGGETGTILDRNIVHEKGLWHREISVWVFNNNGDILVQRRSNNKKMSPNKLEVCAGHVDSNNNSIETVINELSEEIGLNVDSKDVVYLTTEKKEKIFSENSINRIFNDVYYVVTDKNISEFKIQEEELSEVMWINYLDFKNRVLNNDDEIIFKISNSEEAKTFELLDDLYSKIRHN
jgi:isopentenyl-diphosphate Delta-isomerase